MNKLKEYILETLTDWADIWWAENENKRKEDTKNIYRLKN